ncbi:hypothetical protein [Streptomyces sp. C]|uniref:bestrophin-like domain n=1 Tax=Streptomyces sp. C TaxID=253839 RepID=UPI0001B5825F|nr:hypothetical protein [Streptomyces sp. C]EFL15811.1 conserved hypothetical protein [Streptomyces sp. C]
MKLWLLNHLPTTWLALLVVGGVIVLALVGSVLATRFFPVLAAGENNDMVGVVLGMFGAIYGIILAFVIVNLWTDLQTAETVVAAEASAVSQIVRDAEAFPPATRDAVPALLQVLIFGGAAVIILITLLYGVRDRRGRLLFVGSVAALIGFSLLLVIVLDCPFAGDMSVSPQPFKASALARFW